MPYDAVRSRTHRNGKQDLILFDGLTDARSIGAKASHQGSRLPSERPRISPDYSGKVPLSRGKINIPASQCVAHSKRHAEDCLPGVRM